MYKSRIVVNALNISFNESVSINITNLELCDRLDLNHTEMKMARMNNKTNANVLKIKTELAAKLNELEKEKKLILQTAKSLGWVALFVVLILFLFFSLNDAIRLYRYHKEISSKHLKKMETKSNPETFMGIGVGENGNVFKQVIDKDIVLFNHPYFQKLRNMGLK